MGRKDGELKALSPAEKRRNNTACRLREALDRLVMGMPTHPALQKRPLRLTVATLAREARVGRNAIYTNHRSLLDALRHARDHQTTPKKLARWEDKFAEQRLIIQKLQTQLRQLATENGVLLKRCIDAEADAERYKRHNARLLADKDHAQVAVLRGPKPGP